MKFAPKHLVRPKVGDSIRFVADAFIDPPEFRVSAIDFAWDHCVHRYLKWRDEYRVHVLFPGSKLVPYLEHEVIVVPQTTQFQHEKEG